MLGFGLYLLGRGLRRVLVLVVADPAAAAHPADVALGGIMLGVAQRPHA